jgi:hypothetical protein
MIGAVSSYHLKYPICSLREKGYKQHRGKVGKLENFRVKNRKIVKEIQAYLDSASMGRRSIRPLQSPKAH